MNTLQKNTLHGALGSIANSLVLPFTVLFALRLGANNFQTALLSSGPALVALAVLLPAAGWIDKQRNHHQITTILMFAQRAFYLLLIVVPFLWPAARAATFVTLVALMNAPGALANASWQGYVARVFPLEQRAEAFAARNRAINLVGTATTLVAGTLLDLFGGLWGYQLMFLGGFLVGLGEVRVFVTLRSSLPTASSDHQVASGSKRWVQMLSHRHFVHFCLASLLFYFSWQTPWTLFSLYQVKELGAKNAVIGILTLLNTGGNLFGYRFWVAQIQKKGNLHVQWLAALPLVAVPLVYSATGYLPRLPLLGVDIALWVIGALEVIIGATLSGLLLALFNALLEVVPEQGRTSSLALFNTGITITAVVAPFWGVVVYELWGYQTAFLLCAAQRVLGVGALIWLWKRYATTSRDRG